MTRPVANARIKCCLHKQIKGTVFILNVMQSQGWGFYVLCGLSYFHLTKQLIAPTDQNQFYILKMNLYFALSNKTRLGHIYTQPRLAE